MSDDDEDWGPDPEPALAAVEEFILRVAPEQIGNRPLFDVDADEEQLPSLNSIWECPMINKFAGFDNNGNFFWVDLRLVPP